MAALKDASCQAPLTDVGPHHVVRMPGQMEGLDPAAGAQVEGTSTSGRTVHCASMVDAPPTPRTWSDAVERPVRLADQSEATNQSCSSAAYGASSTTDLSLAPDEHDQVTELRRVEPQDVGDHRSPRPARRAERDSPRPRARSRHRASPPSRGDRLLAVQRVGGHRPQQTTHALDRVVEGVQPIGKSCG